MTLQNREIKGLYAVTPDTGDTAVLVTMTQSALAGGARIVQYRNKLADAALRLTQARALLNLCNDRGALFIVNDHVELAAEIGAHGVHIGRDDGLLAAARTTLGPDRIIGVSCYRDFERANAAVTGGADYIAFGGFYPSMVKPGAGGASPALLTQVKSFGVPVVAIGGITPENAGVLINAGADAVAVISALFSVPDITAAAQRFCTLFNTTKS